MNFTETVGMMSTGALIAIGGMYFFGGNDTPPAQPVAALQAPAAVTTQEEAPAQVTRASTDLTAIDPIQQIERVVALSAGGIEMTAELTDEQRQAISFFEDTAREMNEQSRARSGTDMYFSNMAVADLNVRYFYIVPADYNTIDRTEILVTQADMVKRTLCGGEAIMTLMRDYGFEYTYTYLSADHRKIGEVRASAATCA